MMWMKILRIQGDILCVEGDLYQENPISRYLQTLKTKIDSDLKCTLRTPTVTVIDNVTNIIVKRRYFPSRGTARDVGGIISANSRKKTVSDRRMLMQRVTCKAEMRVRCLFPDLSFKQFSVPFLQSLREGRKLIPSGTKFQRRE